MHDATWRQSQDSFGGASHRRGRRRTTSTSQAAAMRALGSVVYAAKLADGTIKIGWTEHFDMRLHWLKNHVQQDVELLAFMLGDHDDEQEIHARLAPYRHHAIEYYIATPEVVAFVNDMRSNLGLSPIAA